MKSESRGRIRRLSSPLATLVALLAAAPVFATGSVSFTIVGAGEATVTLAGPGGATETYKTATGSLAITPKAGAGAYRVTIAIGGRSESADVEVPTSGQINVIYDPDAKAVIQSFVAAIEELTVTSQRVEESIQRIPLAVTAFAARELEVQRIGNIYQSQYRVPNLWMETNTGLTSGSRAAIRGVGEDESFFTSDTPVGIYVDDIYIPRQTGAQFDLYDLERLEVLRGPQGTLYGRNTTAGAIRFVTRQPGNQFRAHVEGTFGEFGRTDGKGSFNFPLGDKAGLQVAGLLRRFTGYDRDTFSNRDVNDQKIGGGRFSLRLLPTSRLNILVVGDLLRERSLPAFPLGFVPQAPFIRTIPPFDPLPSGFGIGPTDISKQLDGDTDIHTLQSDLDNPANDLDQNGIAGTILYAVNDRVTLKSVTGYRDLGHILMLDADGRVGNFLGLRLPDGRPAPSFHLYQNQDQSQFSQELQVQGRAGDRVRYLAGVYIFHEENQQETENVIFAAFRSNNFWRTGLDTDSRAAYGSATIRATDRLTATVGLRYTSDNKVFDTRVFRPVTTTGGAPLIACVGATGVVIAGTRPCGATDPAGSSSVPVERHLDETWDALTPRFALDLQATPELLLYASASRGFKSGAFDGRLNTAATVLPMLPIAPETLWTYEGGIKSDWFQNRLRFNAAGFFNDWSNLQGTGTDPSGNFIRITAGDVQTKGAEFEARGVPVRGLELAGQLSFLRTEYTRVAFNQLLVCGPLGTATTDLELKASPHTSYFLGATYTTPGVTAGGRWSIGSSVAGKSQFWHTSCNGATGSEDGYTLVDAWLAYETRDGRFRVTVAGDNLADEQYITGSFAVAGLRMSSGYFNPPRRFSITLRYAHN